MSLTYAIVENQEEKLYIEDYDEKIHKGKIKDSLGNDLIAVINHQTPHYRHKSNAFKDKWGYSKMSHWHYSFQKIINPKNIEVRIEKEGESHIADIKNNKGIVIELQYSRISNEHIEKREKFYDKMIWLFCRNDREIGYRERDGYCYVKLKRVIEETSKPTYIDLGPNYGIVKIINRDKGFYLCSKISYLDFIKTFFGDCLISTEMDYKMIFHEYKNDMNLGIDNQDMDSLNNEIDDHLNKLDEIKKSKELEKLEKKIDEVNEELKKERKELDLIKRDKINEDKLAYASIPYRLINKFLSIKKDNFHNKLYEQTLNGKQLSLKQELRVIHNTIQTLLGRGLKLIEIARKKNILIDENLLKNYTL